VRIVSLVPSATEIVAELGLASSLVGRSAECTYPREALAAPVVTASRVDTASLASAAIDRSIRDAIADGQPLYAIDGELLERLDPDVILTQDLCEVCAVSTGEVTRLCDVRAETVALDPRTLGEVEESIRTLGTVLGVLEQGVAVATRMHETIERVERSVEACGRPLVFMAEWLDPPFASGHWVPEMVACAGGQEILGQPGERSFGTSWDRVRAGEPDVVVLAPCGFDLERTLSEARALPLIPGRIVAVDGDAYYSRPGPRLADGVRQLGHLLHPDQVPDPELPERELETSAGQVTTR
jgi:iron complex transport system substrate-binding protein